MARTQTAYRFADYAAIVFDALGDRVRHWLTLNEPWCAAFLGYGLGRHAPGVHDAEQSVAAAHHLLLAHGLAVNELRRSTPPGTEVGIVLNLEPARPASDDPADIAAARLTDGMHNRLFLDPVFKGGYPDDVLEHLDGLVDLSHIRHGDERMIAEPLDVLGVNYYRPSLVAARRTAAAEGWSTWPGDELVEWIAQDGPKTAMGWAVDATGLDELLARLHRDYGVPMIVTENGAAFNDEVDGDGLVRDTERVAYLDEHLKAVHRAVEAGVDLRGYFVWSLLDNYEWAEGYSMRFGIVFVDFETQQRIPKESAQWYRRVIGANGPGESV